MDHLPSISPKRLIKVLGRLGFVVTRQNGSHVTVESVERNSKVVVPLHNEDIPRGFMKNILKLAKVSTDEFRKIV
ncbi:MAG: type II toxin-antitoxin system HicA family toxin [Candidatus Taylorbacteria bacterium]|nr:type II toxin-antitoxin system HicA family toxin [Candidatus Taylorbacteria bacterium]